MVSLALLTQYSFLITFIGMCAATLYFILERDSLAPEFRSTASIAACYVGIAAFNYYIMQKNGGTRRPVGISHEFSN
jgi:sensory rhodopsin